MIGIKAISSYIPQQTRDNLTQAGKFGKNEQFVRERIGALHLPIMEEDEDTSDLAVKAIERLLRNACIEKSTIDCMILCTQNPDNLGLPHTSAIVQQKLGLSDGVAALDISLGCSGYVYGLVLIKGFMEVAGLKNGILVTADPYSKIIDSNDSNTAMLFGDAASATLLSNNPVYEIGASMFGTDGGGAQHLINKDGLLHMNGRQIFNFAAKRVPEQINKLLDNANLTIDDIDQFLLHQGSRYIVETLADKLQIPKNKTPILLEEVGNTVSSSIPLILEQSMQQADKIRLLLSGFGVGLSWGSVLLYRSEH